MQDNILKTLRQLHLYVGVFIAPAILFFALTGALQTFSLHEAARGGSYRPANWTLVLAQLHKKQTIQVPPRKAAPVAAAAPDAAIAKPQRAKNGAPAQPPQQQGPNSMPLKIFFLLVSMGLVSSTLTGLYMSWKYNRNVPLLATLFVAGIAVPVLLTIV